MLHLHPMRTQSNSPRVVKPICGGTPPHHASVFVFTLDCNNRIYCYNTDDACDSSCLADTPEIAEVSTKEVINSPDRWRSTVSTPLVEHTILSTVLAQDHFFSDFLSLHLTIKIHKVAMMMCDNVSSWISCSSEHHACQRN